MIKRHSLVATPVLFLALLVVYTPVGVGSVPARAGKTGDQTVANSPRQPAANHHASRPCSSTFPILPTVHQVVVNVRSLSEAGENWAAGSSSISGS